MLTDTKSIWASKTIWGGAIALLAAAAGLLGYAITADQQAELIETGSMIVSAVGGLIALWGRIAATKRIG